MQERLPVGVDVVDVRLVLDERLGEGLLPAVQRDVQREEVALVEAVDADGELEEEEERLIIQASLGENPLATIKIS